MALSDTHIHHIKTILRGCFKWGAIGAILGLILAVVLTAIEGFIDMPFAFFLLVLGVALGVLASLVRSAVQWTFSD